MMQKSKRGAFPAIIFSAIGFQILVCAAVGVVFKDSIKVFIQRDDGTSNIEWLRRKFHELRGWIQGLGGKLEAIKVSVQSWWRYKPINVLLMYSQGEATELRILGNTTTDEPAV
jgi:hypothetical protein